MSSEFCEIYNRCKNHHRRIILEKIIHRICSHGEQGSKNTVSESEAKIISKVVHDFPEVIIWGYIQSSNPSTLILRLFTQTVGHAIFAKQYFSNI